jgi:hypothetical protein
VRSSLHSSAALLQSSIRFASQNSFLNFSITLRIGCSLYPSCFFIKRIFSWKIYPSISTDCPVSFSSIFILSIFSFVSDLLFVKISSFCPALKMSVVSTGLANLLTEFSCLVFEKSKNLSYHCLSEIDEPDFSIKSRSLSFHASAR